jgi:hypothetical protein
MLFPKLETGHEMTTRHRADLSMWSASKHQAESGDFGSVEPEGPCSLPVSAEVGPLPT